MTTATIARPQKLAQPRPPTATPEVSLPMVFKRLDSQTLILDRELARKAASDHSSLPRWEGERVLVESHVNGLVQRIRLGLTIAFYWSTVIYEGVKYRVNGQHSSAAILHALDALDEVVIHLDEYEAPTDVAMGHLFNQFDQQLSIRTRADSAGAWQALRKELRSLNRKIASQGIEAVAWFERRVGADGTPKQIDKSQVHMLFLQPQYVPFLRWLDHVIMEGKSKELEVRPVIACMFGTFLKSEAAAQEFWVHVAKQDLADGSKPPMALDKILHEVWLKRNDKGSSKRDRKPDDWYYGIAARAWNLFRSGDESLRGELTFNPSKGLPDLLP